MVQLLYTHDPIVNCTNSYSSTWWDRTRILTPSRRQNARVTRSSNRMMPSPRSGFEWTPRDMLASLSEGSLHRTWRARHIGVISGGVSREGERGGWQSGHRERATGFRVGKRVRVGIEREDMEIRDFDTYSCMVPITKGGLTHIRREIT